MSHFESAVFRVKYEDKGNFALIMPIVKAYCSRRFVLIFCWISSFTPAALRR